MSPTPIADPLVKAAPTISILRNLVSDGYPPEYLARRLSLTEFDIWYLTLATSGRIRSTLANRTLILHRTLQSRHTGPHGLHITAEHQRRAKQIAIIQGWRAPIAGL